MSSVALLFVLMCVITFSLHASNARLLAFSDKQVGHNSDHFAKEVEKAKLSHDETLNSRSKLEADHSIPLVEFQMEENQTKNNGRIRNKNLGANALTPDILMLTLKKHDMAAHDLVADGPTSGNGITKSFSQVGLQQSIETKGQEGHARSMLGSSPQDTEEAVDTKEGDTVEDIVVMDYAQAHRKPPIHNEKP